MNVRVRGIYATALTRLLLDADYDVVQASPPIRERFDAGFAVADHDVDVKTTSDRQGVTVEGDADAVQEVVSTSVDVGIDAFAWPSKTPRGAVFDGLVTETKGDGAEVDLGDAAGVLPFRHADDYVEEGDRLRVQVLESPPPWDGDEALLDTDIVAPGGLASLLRGRDGDVVVAGGDRAAGQEVVGFTELLNVDVPDGWGIRWQRGAADAGIEEMDAALRRAVAVAETVGDGMKEPVSDTPRQVVAPTAVTHVWFGRACRFELDEIRRTVETTMPGHHRTKATAGEASAGVDLVEALCDPTGEFPFGVVTDQFGPVNGDSVRIGHGKPDGRLIVLGKGDVTSRTADGTVDVHREMTPGGTYDELPARREAGDQAVTKFEEGRWWYPTVYRDDEGVRKGTYVNICTPVEIFPNLVRYVDLHVDVVKTRDDTVKRVDDDELEESVEAGHIADPLAEKARSVATALEAGLRE
jgi:Ribonuclease G/E